MVITAKINQDRGCRVLIKTTCIASRNREQANKTLKELFQEAGDMPPVTIDHGLSSGYTETEILNFGSASVDFLSNGIVDYPVVTPRDKYENLLLALLEQRAGVEAPISYPIALVLDPSSACQLNCMFCRAHSTVPILTGRDEFMRARSIMKLDAFQAIIEEIGPYLFSAWLCNWGEPLLNNHLVDMVRTVKRCGIETVGFSSNFSMNLKDETIYGLVDSGLDNITLSIDGVTQEAYEKYRVNGNLAVVLSNLERLIAAKKELNRLNPHIIWQFLVFAHNEGELPQARAHAERLGVDFIPLAPVVDLVNYPGWLSERWVMEKYKKREEIPPHDIDEAMGSLSRYRPKRCDWHYLIGTVNANGSVSACCSIAREADDFGTLDGKRFIDVWNNKHFRTARRNQSHVCTKCTWPELLDNGQDTARYALRNAPQEIKEKAKQLLPDHPLVKELIEVDSNEEVARLQELVHQNGRRISILQEEVENRDKSLRERDQGIAEIKRELVLKEASLHEIYNSTGWKALTTYYRIRDKMLRHKPTG